MNSNKSEIVVRQRRASRPKVKTGCNNCKKRKVKCDEMRPACKRCVKAKVACEGYPAYRRITEAPLQIAPRPENGSPMSSTSPTSSTVSPQAIVPARRISPVIQIRNTPPRSRARTTPSPTTYVPGIRFNAQEGQYLQVFRTHTAVELSGFFNSEFWSRSVLQESQSEAAIRHAVVAIGALYKTLEKSAESPPGSPDINAHETPTAHYNFALEQYGKAIHRLHEALANKDAPERTVLMFAILLTCFQSFIGDHKAAIWQIQTGLRMLEDRRKESRQPLLTRKQDHIEDELIQMFTRLAIQAKSYDMAFHLPDVVIQLSPKNDPATPQSPGSPSDAASSASIDSFIPEQFTSAQKARCSLDSLTERIMRFNEVLSSLNPGPNNILPRSVQHQGAGFVVALRQWGAAFEELLKGRRNPGVTNTDRAGILVLGMMHLMTSILFQMGYSTSEMGFDKFVPEFAQIVDLAKEIVVDEELSLASKRCGSDPACRHRAEAMRFGQQDAYLHVKSSFALDLGIVPPLFVAATKCRHRRIRREAIRLLLSSHRREGMWDSILSGFVAGWIMGIEEHGMMPFDQFNPAGVQVVPEDKRVMVKEIDFNFQEKIARLRCGTRGKRDGDEDRRARVTMVRW